MPSKLLSRAIKEFKTDSLRDYHVAQLADEFTYSLHDGGSHGINLAMAGVMQLKTSCASFI